MEEKKRTFESTALKTLATLGLIALLGIGLWGSVQLVRVMPGAFSRIGGAVSSAAASLSSIFVPAEHLTMTVESGTVNSGETMNISWEHRARKADGTYVFTYECRSGVSFEVAKEDGTYQQALCDTPIQVPGTGDAGAFKVIPVSSTTRFMDVPMTVSFASAAVTDAKISDRVLVTIVNNDVKDGQVVATSTPVTTTGGTKTPTETKPPVKNPVTVTPGPRATSTIKVPVSGTPQSNPNGRADLAVVFTGIGYLDNATNEFVASSTPMPNQKVAVRFEIQNIGNKETGEWTFSAVLPTTPFYIYQSSMQRNLQPGDKIEYTLGFDMVKNEKEVEVLVNVDNARPSEAGWYGNVKESNEANNVVKQKITLSVIR